MQNLWFQTSKNKSPELRCENGNKICIYEEKNSFSIMLKVPGKVDANLFNGTRDQCNKKLDWIINNLYNKDLIIDLDGSDYYRFLNNQ